MLRLATNLRKRAVPIWLDQWDIAPGADWDQTIDEALRASDKFIVVLSPAAVASKQVRGEIQAAVDANKLVVPLLYQPCEIPRLLRLIQHVNFTDGRVEDQVERLVQWLQAAEIVPRPPIPWTIKRGMGIPFTDLSGRVRTSSADDRVIWRRSHSDRLLGEPVEEQAAGL